jgi:hypothetical protein
MTEEESGYEQSPQPDPELPATPQPETGGTMTEEQKKILAALDDQWGTLDRIEAGLLDTKTETQRLRSQLLAIKDAAGLNAPNPKA